MSHELLSSALFRETRGTGFFRVLAGGNAAFYVDALDDLERESSDRPDGMAREEAIVTDEFTSLQDQIDELKQQVSNWEQEKNAILRKGAHREIQHTEQQLKELSEQVSRREEPSLALVPIDEAFSKLSGERIQNCIQAMSELDLQGMFSMSSGNIPYAFRQCDELIVIPHLPLHSHPLDPQLLLARLGAAADFLSIDDLQRQPSAQIFCCLRPLRNVLPETPLHIGCDPGVERAVATADDIDRPTGFTHESRIFSPISSMKRNRWRENPTGLEPLAAQARDYALHMMKTTGSVPPTVIADTAEGYVQPFIAASGLSLQEICQRMQRPEGKTLITPKISTSAFQKSSDLPYPS